jgi:hypothetical protein
MVLRFSERIVLEMVLRLKSRGQLGKDESEKGQVKR